MKIRRFSLEGMSPSRMPVFRRIHPVASNRSIGIIILKVTESSVTGCLLFTHLFRMCDLFAGYGFKKTVQGKRSDLKVMNSFKYIPEMMCV